MEQGFLELLVKSSGPTRIVRLANLIYHPAQRPVSKEAVERAFENWGANIDTEGNVLEVMAMDDRKLPGEVNEVCEAPKEDKFYILDGQHRVQVLRKAIRVEIAEEHERAGNLADVTEKEVEAHPRACWPARIYYRGTNNEVED